MSRLTRCLRMGGHDDVGGGPAVALRRENPNVTLIDVRPAEVADLAASGRSEGDLIPAAAATDQGRRGAFLAGYLLVDLVVGFPTKRVCSRPQRQTAATMAGRTP